MLSLLSVIWKTDGLCIQAADVKISLFTGRAIFISAMPLIYTSDIYPRLRFNLFVNIARVKNEILTYLLTYLIATYNSENASQFAWYLQSESVQASDI